MSTLRSHVNKLTTKLCIPVASCFGRLIYFVIGKFLSFVLRIELNVACFIDSGMICHDENVFLNHNWFVKIKIIIKQLIREKTMESI